MNLVLLSCIQVTWKGPYQIFVKHYTIPHHSQSPSEAVDAYEGYKYIIETGVAEDWLNHILGTCIEIRLPIG